MGMKVPKGMCNECLAPTEKGAKRCPAHQGKSKFKNVKTTATIGGRTVRFDSRREEKRFSELSLLLELGRIILLARQERFWLVVNGQRVCIYVADFSYIDLATGRYVIEDAKGVRTRAYRVKAKLFKALTGYTITEV